MNRKPDLNNNEEFIESEEYGPISELDYRFFEYMQEGVIVSAPIYKGSKVVDLIIKYANLVAYRQRKDLKTGLTDKSIKEIYDPETVAFELEKANKVVSTGRGIKYEAYRTQIDKYISITAFSPSEDLYVTFSTDITEQKKASERLKTEKDKLLNIIEFLPDATFVIDECGIVIAWNKALEEMTGVPKEEIIGKDDYVYSVPFYGHKRPVVIDLIFLSEEEIESKYTYVKRDGETLFAEVFVNNLFGGKGAYVFVKASPLYDSAGKLVGSIETVRDITKQKKTKEKLKYEQNLLNTILNNIPVAVAVAEAPSGKLIRANEQFEKVWEQPFIPSKNIESYSTYKGFHQEGSPYKPEEWPLARSITTGEEVIGEEISVLFEDGTRKVLIVSSTPIKDENGQTILGVVIAADISARKKAEELLMENEEKFAKAFYSNSAGMAITAINGEIIEVNKAYADITGYNQEELLGKTVIDLNIISIEERDNVLKILTKGDSIYNKEREIQTKTGEKRTVLYTVDFIEYGGEKKVFSIIYDITDLKKSR